MRVYGALVRYSENYDCYGFYGLVSAVLEDVAVVAGEEEVVQEASAWAVVHLESPVATQGSDPSQLFQGDVVVKEEQVRIEIVEPVLVLGYYVEVVEPVLGNVEVVEPVLGNVEAVEPVLVLGYYVEVESVLVLVYVEVESVEAVESVLVFVEAVEPVLQVEVVAAVEPPEPEEAPAEAV